MPTVSVIIPNYNHARYLRQRIDTVLGQTYRDFEVILLDDCSTDDSHTIIAEYAKDPRVRVELNSENSGSPFKQWNKGVGLARGEYVWIAESDDYADGRLLERLVGVLEAEPDLVFAYCRSWRVFDDGRADAFADDYLEHLGRRRLEEDFRADGREECEKYFVCTNPVPNASAVVFRKTMYKSVGGADETLHICGDWKLWAAMAFEGRIAYLCEPLNYFRAHDTTVRSRSTRIGVNAVEALQVIRWILQRVSPTPEVWRRLRKATLAYWPQAVISPHVPLRVKLRILQDARAIDPDAMKRLIRPAIEALRFKLVREWRLARQRLHNRAS